MPELTEMKCGPRRMAVAAIAILTVSGLCSCSKAKKQLEVKGSLPVHPVKGTLLMDGKPVPQASLIFFPVNDFPKGAAKTLPHARTTDDGTFQVTTYRGNDGAPAAEYRVTVSWKGPAQGVSADKVDELPEKLPKIFQNSHQTKLVAVIKEGENDLPTWDIGEEVQRQASNSP
jgi:hypothetical protein